MTLRLVIKNDGNQPGDTAVFKGIKEYDSDPSSECRAGSVTGNANDVVHLVKGEEIIIYPPCDHFDDFEPVLVKGKH